MDNYPTHPQEVSPFFKSTIEKMNSDMRFVGVFAIVIGGLYTVTIIGAIMGVPLIFIGIRLREATENFDMYSRTDDKVMLERAFEKQQRAFYIQKILIIVYIVFMALYFAAIAVFLIIGFGSGFFDQINQYPSV